MIIFATHGIVGSFLWIGRKLLRNYWRLKWVLFYSLFSNWSLQSCVDRDRINLWVGLDGLVPRLMGMVHWRIH